MDRLSSLCRWYWNLHRLKGTGEVYLRLVGPDPPALTAQLVCRLHTGTVIQVTGEWRPSPAGKEQSHELRAQGVRVLGSVDAEVGG